MIGSYAVGIRSEISIPVDHTGETFTTLTSEYEFTIFVEPCLVNTFKAVKVDGDIIYTIGGPELPSVTPFRFSEDPICSYPRTVTFTSLPDFVH